MFTNWMKSLAARTGMKTAVAAALMCLSPAAALAGHHDFNIDLDFHHGRPHIEIHQAPPPPPVYEQREVRVWVEPVYRTVTDRQWVAPEYRTVSDRVWVPDQYELRDVSRFEHGRRYLYRERVLVQPGHYDMVTRQELVCDGHWQNVERQELVTPGHYETRIENVPLAAAPAPLPPY